jgi:uncharacterized protein YggU (UPF0235/DUF167 family)
MIGREFNFHNGQKGSALAIRITSKEGDKKIAKVLRDGTVVVNLEKDTEDPNKEIVKLLAEVLGISQKRFDIIAGRDGNEKLLSILDIDPEKVQELVLNCL